MTYQRLNYVTRTHLSRRAFLRGAGATFAMPLLDAMVPALGRCAGLEGFARLGIIMAPNGMVMENWTPKKEGPDFDIPPILLPLAPYRENMLVLSGLAARTATPIPGEGTGDHARASATFLTGVRPRKTEGLNIQAGTSVDQIAAREMGKQTQLSSIEVGLDSTEFAGACDGNYSCAYINSIAWINPTTALPAETNPRLIFERLFGESDSTDPEERLVRMREKRSILDSIVEDANRLKARLDAGDSSKLNQYLEAIRDVERRIQKAEEQSTREMPNLSRPAGIPETFEQHIKLMFDLQVLAYQADMTRVITFMVGRESTNRPYPEIGVSEAHHPLSHHQNDPEKIAKLSKINVYHSEMVAYFLERLRSTPDGTGSLLDHVMLLYGGAISDSNQHLHDNLPILLIGGGGGRIKGGRHIRLKEETPLTNLHLTILEKLGISIEQFGDSTGKIGSISEV